MNGAIAFLRAASSSIPCAARLAASILNDPHALRQPAAASADRIQYRGSLPSCV